MGLYFTWFVMLKTLAFLAAVYGSGWLFYKGKKKLGGVLAAVTLIIMVFTPFKLENRATEIVRQVQNQAYERDVVFTTLPPKVQGEKFDFNSFSTEKEKEFKAKADETLEEALAK